MEIQSLYLYGGANRKQRGQVEFHVISRVINILSYFTLTCVQLQSLLVLNICSWSIFGDCNFTYNYVTIAHSPVIVCKNHVNKRVTTRKNENNESNG